MITNVADNDQQPECLRQPPPPPPPIASRSLSDAPDDEAVLRAAYEAARQSNDDAQATASQLISQFSTIPSARTESVDVSWCFDLRQDHTAQSPDDVLDLLGLFDELDSIPEPVVHQRPWSAVGASGVVCTVGGEEPDDPSPSARHVAIEINQPSSPATTIHDPTFT